MGGGAKAVSGPGESGTFILTDFRLESLSSAMDNGAGVGLLDLVAVSFDVTEASS